jgi:hypothetical protein
VSFPVLAVSQLSHLASLQVQVALSNMRYGHSYYYCVNLIWIHLQVHMKLLFMAYGIVLIRVNMIDWLINAVVARMP